MLVGRLRDCVTSLLLLLGAIACAVSVSALLSIASPSVAYASTETQEGAFLVTVEDGDAADYSYDEATGTLTISSGALTVRNADPSTPASDRIHITGSADVTFAGLNLADTNGGHPVQVDDASGTSVIIRLSGANTIAAAGFSTSGIYKGSGAGTLTITSASGDGSAEGELNISATNGWSACIGASGSQVTLANLEIAGGTYSLTAPVYTSVPIGGADWGSTSNSRISGGYISVNAFNAVFGYSSRNANNQMAGGVLVINAGGFLDADIVSGIVSYDGGETFEVHGNATLEVPLEIPDDSSLDIPEGSSLSVEGGSLTSDGTIYATGAIRGPIINNGVIYDEGGLEQAIVSGSGDVRRQYVEVEQGSGDGVYEPGQTVSIEADAAEEGMPFARWDIVHGEARLADRESPQTNFEMPEGCVVVRPVYVPIIAVITNTAGEKTYITKSDEFEIRIESESGDTVEIVHWDEDVSPIFEIYPFDSVRLDLGGLNIASRCWLTSTGSSSIRNGSLNDGDLDVESGTLALDDLSIGAGSGSSFWLTIASGAVLVVGDNVTFGEQVYFSGEGTVETSCTDTTDYGELQVEKRHAWDEGRYADGKVLYTCTECGETRTVTPTIGKTVLSLQPGAPVYDGDALTASDLGLVATWDGQDCSGEVVLSYAAVDGDGPVGEQQEGLPTVAGVYCVTASLPTKISEDGAVVYEQTSASANVTIMPRKVGVVWHNVDGRVSGDGLAATAELTNVVPGDDVRAEVTGGDADTEGTHTATAQLAGIDSVSYVFSDDAKVSATYIIAPALQAPGDEGAGNDHHEPSGDGDGAGVADGSSESGAESQSSLAETGDPFARFPFALLSLAALGFVGCCVAVFALRRIRGIR